VHAIIFFILSLLLFLYAFKKNQAWPWWTFYCILAILYGISLEIMQAKWFIHRSFDYFDMVANSIGCLAAFALQKVLHRKFQSLAK